MKEITGINHIGIRVSDLESARSFYERLGFILIAGPLGPEPVAMMTHPSGVTINFSNYSAHSVMNAPIRPRSFS